MTVYNSYSDYTTKNCGVIEGFGGGRKKGTKLGTLYRQVATNSVPATHQLLKHAANLNKLDKCFTEMLAEKKTELRELLDRGGVAKVRGDKYVMLGKNGLYAIYAKQSTPMRATKKTLRKLAGAKRQATFDKNYAHLLQVNASRRK